MGGEKPAGGSRRGRGATLDRATRFYERSVELDAGEEAENPGTRFLEDRARSILSRNTSPDLPFSVGLNPYRGCEHGCAYCYARPGHEYLGFSPGLEFETRIMVKRGAPALLREAFAKRGYRPEAIALSGVTDCYQPVERRLGITRGCLEVLAEHRHPVSIVTKNALVLRDLDLLRELAAHGCVSVRISLTTLDPALHRVMEPRSSTPRARLDAVRRLRDAGVPVGVMVAPVIPALTDEEIPALLEAAAEHGAERASMIVLRLPDSVAPIFEAWLREHFPERAGRVLSRVRALRGGKLNDARFGVRHRGEGPFAKLLSQMFSTHRRRLGLGERGPELRTDAFRPPGGRQGTLFEV